MIYDSSENNNNNSNNERSETILSRRSLSKANFSATSLRLTDPGFLAFTDQLGISLTQERLVGIASPALVLCSVEV